MKKREVREARDFTSELKALLPNTKEADELLSDAIAYLSYLAENGAMVGGTNIYFKIVPDVLRRKRFLVIFYTIDNGIVTLQSVRAFST